MWFDNFLGDTLILVTILFSGIAGGIVGSFFRREVYAPRHDAIGLGAGLLVWLGSKSGVQIISLGVPTSSASNNYSTALLAFVAGFAAEKVFLSLANLPARVNDSSPKKEDQKADDKPKADSKPKARTKPKADGTPKADSAPKAGSAPKEDSAPNIT